jgi:hypothetical protein
MTDIDRRRFLLAAASAAGVGLTGGTGAWAASARRTRVEVHAATYRALVRSLSAAPDGRFRHADPAAAYRHFRRWYLAQPAVVRTHADAVLDKLEADGRPDYTELAFGDAACRSRELLQVDLPGAAVEVALALRAGVLDHQPQHA